MPWFSDTPVKRRSVDKLSRSRAILWWGLGAYVLLSGLIQIPPQVALGGHAYFLRMPSVMNQIGLGRVLQSSWIRAWSLHPITYNILSFMVQAVLGIFLLTERGTLLGRITVVFTMGWGFLIWVFPEGLGLLFSSSNSLMSGSPGAGIMVVAVLALLLVPNALWHEEQWLQRLSWIWTIIWGLGSLWQWSFLTPNRQRALYGHGLALPQPSVVRLAIYGVEGWAVHNAILADLIVIVLMIVVAVGGGVRRTSGFRWLATVILVVFWWIGQDFGLMAQYGLLLNTAPLWGVLIWALPEIYREDRASKLVKKDPSQKVLN